jgi:hypothetical protein
MKESSSAEEEKVAVRPLKTLEDRCCIIIESCKRKTTCTSPEQGRYRQDMDRNRDITMGS